MIENESEARNWKKNEKGGRKCTLQSFTVSPLPLPFVLCLFLCRLPFLSPLSRFPFFFACVSGPLLFSSTSNSPQLYIWSCFGTTATSGPHVCRQKQQSKLSRYNEPSDQEGEAVSAREEVWRGGGMHKMKRVKWHNVEKSKAERLAVILKATRCLGTWRLGWVWPLGSTRGELISCATLRVYHLRLRLRHQTGWQPVRQKKDKPVWGSLSMNPVALKPAWPGWTEALHASFSTLTPPCSPHPGGSGGMKVSRC